MAKLLKLLPPLLGGFRKASLKLAVSEAKGTAGLQKKMKRTYASSILSAVTSSSGSLGLTVNSGTGDAVADNVPA